MTDSILILNVSGIGDFVDSTAALRTLRRLRPDSRITLVVSRKVLPLARDCPYADQVIGLPTSFGRGIPPFQDSLEWLRKFSALRGKFSTLVHLYPVYSTPGAVWMRALLWWIAAGTTIGNDRYGKASFYTRSLAADPQPQTQVEAFLRLVSLAGSSTLAASANRITDAQERRLELWIPESTREEMRLWLEQAAPSWGALSGPLVTVALGGERPSRHELPERAAQWLSRIQQRWQIRPLIIGTPSDPAPTFGEGLRFIDTRGAFDLLHTAALVSFADLVITTHSSPQHLAGVWQKPTVVLAGPGNTEYYRPSLTPERMRILQHPVPCSPCYHLDCPLPHEAYKQCLRGIPVEAVVNAFGELHSQCRATSSS